VRAEVIPTALLPDRAALWLADRIWTAVADRGVAHLAVSGGSTPAAMFASLASMTLPWSSTHIWQVDERIAPDGDPDRNANQLAVFGSASTAATVHLMGVTASDPVAASDLFAAELHRACGGVLDIVHLGLGDDGHTASWPPGDLVLTVADRDVALSGPYKGRVRMTLTPPAVNRARAVMFLVAGETKSDAVAKLIQRDPSIPASAVRASSALLLADGPAMGVAGPGATDASS
jgi:6-phosphogluconolactonase